MHILKPQKGFNTQLMGKDLLLVFNFIRLLEKLEKIFSIKVVKMKLYLNHLQKVIDNKTTNADHMINKFSKNEDLNELYDK